MFKGTITIVTLMSFVLYLYGCSSIEVVKLNESNLDDFKDSDIISVVTKDNKIYEFDTKGVKPKPQYMDSLLVGWAISELKSQSYKLKEVKVPVSEIRSMGIEKTDLMMGGLATIGILALILGFPFILAMSGKDFF